MGKKQKNALLDEALCRLVDAHQARSGATFARICSAALLEYLLFNGSNPDPFWMKSTIALEKGEASIREIANDAITRSLLGFASPAVAATEDREWVTDLLKDTHEVRGQWFQSTAEDDPVEAVIKLWDLLAESARRRTDKSARRRAEKKA